MPVQRLMIRSDGKMINYLNRIGGKKDRCISPLIIVEKRASGQSKVRSTGIYCVNKILLPGKHYGVMHLWLLHYDYFYQYLGALPPKPSFGW